jgi:glycosyltransferase involved in cell wall biosynthesis
MKPATFEPPTPPTPPTADQITIAITVFHRTEFIRQAIDSALDQTVPVRVIVVEDCAPSDEVRALVEKTYGDRVRYFRNPKRRGTFDNWNACLEDCETAWISILHDDDFLRPNFVETMLEVAEAAPPAGAYFSWRAAWFDDRQVYQEEPADPRMGAKPWRVLDLETFALTNQVYFPGQLLHVESVRSLGGFRGRSLYAGDWEMWFKLAFHFGAVQTRAAIGVGRSHSGLTRETNRIVRSGRRAALDIVQTRRNFTLLRSRFPKARFDRRDFLAVSPLPIKSLLACLNGFSPRIARYHLGLLLASKPPSNKYRLFQLGAAWGRLCFLYAAARLSRWRR